MDKMVVFIDEGFLSKLSKQINLKGMGLNG